MCILASIWWQVCCSSWNTEQVCHISFVIRTMQLRGLGKSQVFAVKKICNQRCAAVSTFTLQIGYWLKGKKNNQFWSINSFISYLPQVYVYVKIPINNRTDFVDKNHTVRRVLCKNGFDYHLTMQLSNFFYLQEWKSTRILATYHTSNQLWNSYLE